MTMLDRMRRHKGWLKWSLAIVVVAFILLYIPDFLRDPSAGAGLTDVVATVDGRDVTVGRFQRVYQQQLQAYRSAYGANMDDRLLRQLGIEQRIIQQMIEEELALAEASRLKITASDAEVRARILALPAFQENGRFIGDQRYRQLLQMQNPPMRPDEFEEQVRRGIILEKLQGALTEWVTVGDSQVDAEYRRRNEKVKLAVVAFPADKFRDGVTATDDELTAHFEADKERYRIPEKRKVRYALIDLNAIRERTQIPPQDIERQYVDNREVYSTPEQVRASHILFMTEGKDEAAVRKQAEEVLARAKAGADFAKLANEYTDEEVGKSRGGDLDFFGRGQMAPEFEEAAFALQPGELSDIVKTQFGLHIIKVTDRRAAATKSLDEVRSQIEDQLRWQRAQDEMQKIADGLGGTLQKPEDLDSVARARGLTVSESGFFSSDEPITGLGIAPGVGQEAFRMKQGEVSDAIRTPQGIVYATVTGIQEARLPSLDEVRARVRDDVVKKKALEAARQKAASLAAGLKSGDLAAAAKAAGLEVTTTDLIARGAPIANTGVSPAIDEAAFALPAGAVSQPIVTDTGAVVVKVLEKKDVTAEEIASGRHAVKEDLLGAERDRFYGAYMAKVRERLRDRIQINSEVLAQLLG
ncbi:MAG TPA: peptidyl-prolyl cis-trans isomerase [Vicinamibacterales bacterium]|nr:peptidyl-prolyl cis-trans isomerase [Vicinamibacterales bacterium]